MRQSSANIAHLVSQQLKFAARAMLKGEHVTLSSDKSNK